jgi:Recombinase/Recombinase zinc beta ribbon domain
VRRVFEWMGWDRLTRAAVCRRLQAAGILSPTGNVHWSRAMIYAMLLNPTYVGRAIYGRRQCVPWQAPLHRRRGHDGVPRRPYRQIPAPPEQQVTVPVPAIVDEALFASVAEQLAENRRRSRERLAGVRYLLRGLLVCQKCGYSFTGHYHRGQYRYYRCCGTDCSRYHGEFRCDARLVAVEPLVWHEVCRIRHASWRNISGAWKWPVLVRDGSNSTSWNARSAATGGQSTGSSTATPRASLTKASSSRASPTCADGWPSSRRTPSRFAIQRSRRAPFSS